MWTKKTGAAHLPIEIVSYLVAWSSGDDWYAAVTKVAVAKVDVIEEIADGLLSSLGHRRPEVRVAGLRGLAQLPPQFLPAKAEEEVTSLLRNQINKVRFEAVKTLGAITRNGLTQNSILSLVKSAPRRGIGSRRRRNYQSPRSPKSCGFE